MPRWIPLLVLAAAWLAHAPALNGGWLGDDIARVRDNAVVDKGLAGASEAFRTDAWGGETGAGAWRPLAVVSYCLDAEIWRGNSGRLDAFGFHLTNLLLHGIAAVLVLLLGWRLAPGSPALVAAAAFLFAVHPLYAGTVATLAGRADLLALLFSLTALWLWVEAGRGRPALLPLAALSFFIALLSKETALGLPLVIVALEAGLAGRDLGGDFRRRAAGYAVLLVPLVLWALRWPADLGGVGARFGVGVEGLGRAVVAFFVPLDLVRDRFAVTDGLTRLDPAGLGLVVGGLVLAAALVAVLAFLVRRQRGPLLLAVVSVAGMWIVASIVAPLGAPLEATFAYVPGLALVLVGAWLLQAILVLPTGRPVPVGVVGTLVLLVALGALTWRESKVWRDDRTYQQALLDRYPLRNATFLETARRYRERAAAERKILDETAIGWLDEAHAWSLAAVRRADPLDRGNRMAADAYREHGLVLQDLGRAADAVRSLRKAARLDAALIRPSGAVASTPERKRWLVETYTRLARAEQTEGNLAEAVTLLEAATDFAPLDYEVHRAAGRALIQAHQYASGLKRLARSMELAPDGRERSLLLRELSQARQAAAAAADHHLRDARAAVERGEYREAIAAYKDALHADATLLRAYEELAFYLGQWFGAYPIAFDWIEKARQVLRKAGRAHDDPWWEKLAMLQRKLEEMRERDDAEERDPPTDDD